MSTETVFDIDYEKETPVKDLFNENRLLIFYDKKIKTAGIENEQGAILLATTSFW